MQHDLTRGPITRTMLLFAGPMIAGNLLQQFYNIADTLIVGQFLGAQALAAVGSAFTLMTFLTSILLGLCMGSGAVFSIRYGERNEEKLKSSIFVSFVMIALVTLVMNLLVFLLIDPIIRFMNIPSDVYGMMRDYLWVIFAGIGFVFLYNYFAALLRAVGNSLAPLLFLAVSAVTNIVLDLLFVVTFQRGVAGAAEATVIAQALSAVGIAAYTFIKFPAFRPDRRYMKMNRQILREIFQYAFLTCIQQSVMNFGILLVQGLVNSFGTAVMAAFAAAVKIDAFAYMPVQDFGNAFSTFAAQNFGAKKEERIRRGIRSAIGVTVVFCLIVSLSSRRRPRFWRWGRSTCASRAPSTAGSAACFCSTASTVRCAVRASRWCSPSSRWAQGWCCPTCWPPFRPSGWWGSGGPSRLAGCLPTWRGCSITKSLKSSCWNNCKKSKKRPGKGSLFLCLLGGSSL